MTAFLNNQEFRRLEPRSAESCVDHQEWSQTAFHHKATKNDFIPRPADVLINRTRIQRISSDMLNATSQILHSGGVRKSQSEILSSEYLKTTAFYKSHEHGVLSCPKESPLATFTPCQRDIIHSHRRIVESDQRLLNLSLPAVNSPKLSQQDRFFQKSHPIVSIAQRNTYTMTQCQSFPMDRLVSPRPSAQDQNSRKCCTSSCTRNGEGHRNLRHTSSLPSNAETEKDLHSRATVWSRAALTPACAVLMRKVLNEFAKNQSKHSSFHPAHCSCPLGEPEDKCVIARTLSQRNITPRKANTDPDNKLKDLSCTDVNQTTNSFDMGRKRKMTPLHIIRCVYFDLAATTIQRIWRGYVGRKLAAYNRVKIVADNLLHHSATLIQSVWRGSRARWQLYLLFHIRMHAMARETAAKRIQRAWRRWKQFLLVKIKELSIIMSGMRNLSAVIIQKAWRGHQVRKIVDEEWKYWVVKWVWDPPGRKVEILGDFTDPPWKVRIPMTFCPYRRCYVARLPRKQSRCELKFSVENRFVCCGAGTVIEDGSGHYNNLVDVFDVPAESPFLRGRRAIKAIKNQATESQKSMKEAISVDIQEPNSNGSELDGGAREFLVDSQEGNDRSNLTNYSQTSDEPLTSIDSHCISEQQNFSEGEADTSVITHEMHELTPIKNVNEPLEPIPQPIEQIKCDNDEGAQLLLTQMTGFSTTKSEDNPNQELIPSSPSPTASRRGRRRKKNKRKQSRR